MKKGSFSSAGTRCTSLRSGKRIGNLFVGNAGSERSLLAVR